MVLVAISMVAILGMAAWSIDLVTLYLAREEAQRSADAAALTAARIISVSGITGSTSTQTTLWQDICGTNGIATLAAQAVGGQNSVAQKAATVTVTYAAGPAGSSGGGGSDCSTVSSFTINPLVTVKVQQAGLATFFSRIWGRSGSSISATATAEVFNPSASDTVGTSGAVTPVQPRCVKPWMVPNRDPGGLPSGNGCSGLNCANFVSTADGLINRAGISLGGTSTVGVIGETFTIFADCGTAGSACIPTNNPPIANSTSGTYEGIYSPPAPPNLEYLPGQVESAPVAVPACATSGSGGSPFYEPAVAGCDQSTQYQCGMPLSSNPSPNRADLSENPGGLGGDTANGLACSLTYPNQAALPLTGLDTLDDTTYPFKITAGTSNPLRIVNGTATTSSNQIVSLPIYDDTVGLSFSPGGTTPVTIVGFLQVFINQVNPDGSVTVTVLNVAGCGNGTPTAPNPAVTGSSPVPIRLITPP